MAMNREQKRMMRRQGQDPDGETTRRQAAPPQRSQERTTARQFFGEVRSELRKVAWPGWPEVLNSSVVVLVTLTLVTVLIALLDWAFGQASLALFES